MFCSTSQRLSQDFRPGLCGGQSMCEDAVFPDPSLMNAGFVSLEHANSIRAEIIHKWKILVFQCSQVFS